MTVDVGFEVQQREDGTFRVRTSGMGRRGRPEIEMTSLVPTQVELATDLLGRVAASVAQRPVFAGQVMSVAPDLSVELQESEHVQVGFLARALGASDRTVMRVTDEGRATSDGVLCAAARMRARELNAGGDATAAARVLHDALDAMRTDDASVTGERAQASVQLSYIEEDAGRAIELLLDGLHMSTDVQRAELGGTFDEIQRFDPGEIVTQLRQVSTVNLGLVDAEGIDNTVRIVPSPIWLRADDGRAELGMTMIPGPWLRLYWNGATRVELQSGLAPAIAGDVFSLLAKSASGIARLAYVTREAASSFPITHGAPRASASPGPTPPHIFLASAALALVARQRTAGMTRNEIMAAFGLNRDHNDWETARDKGRRLRVRLAQWTRDGHAGRRV